MSDLPPMERCPYEKRGRHHLMAMFPTDAVLLPLRRDPADGAQRPAARYADGRLAAVSPRVDAAVIRFDWYGRLGWQPVFLRFRWVQ